MTAPPWFIAPPDSWTETTITLPPEEGHHALKVLRVRVGDEIVVTDGAGRVARCRTTLVQGDALVCDIVHLDRVAAPAPEIAVYQGAAKGHKVDGVVERLAELGVAEVHVYQSARTVVRWDASKAAKNAARWKAIAHAAAKQSRSPFLLRTGPALAWDEFLDRIAREEHVIVLWEEAPTPARDALPAAPERIAVVVGPEGGLERSEVDALIAAGAQPVSLGARILRTENAAVVATSALLYHYGLLA